MNHSYYKYTEFILRQVCMTLCIYTENKKRKLDVFKDVKDDPTK